MLKYVFKRILAMIPVLFIISIVIFGTVKAMPGDEVTAYFGAGSKVTQEQRDHVRELLGLDKSLPEQYVRWVGRMCTGDLGSSITLKKPVGTIIGDYVWNTFYLNVVSLIVALIFAIPVGIKQAVKKGSVFDNFWTVFSLLGISVPTFFFALVFSGAVIWESVFIWPGIGKVLIDAINQRDNSLVMACLMFSALLMLLGNLLSDICYTLVDPRIKVDE